MDDDTKKEKHGWIEEIEIVGDQLVGRVSELFLPDITGSKRPGSDEGRILIINSLC